MNEIEYAIEKEKKAILEIGEIFYKKMSYRPKIVGKYVNSNLKDLIKKISNITNCNIEINCRSDIFLKTRAVYYYIAFKSGYSLKEIGGSLNKDHTTVMAGLNKFHKLIKKDEKFKELINIISSKL
jgi:chromosomal replication initiation ATPase DnaA